MTARTETMQTGTVPAIKSASGAQVTVHSVSKTVRAGVQATRQLDPFADYYGDSHRILNPRFNPFSLASLTEASDVLGRAIEAMANNIDGFGWELQPAEWVDEAQMTSKEALAEKSLLTRLFNYPNDKLQNLVGLRHDMRVDRESIGCGYWEIVRNRVAEIAEIHLLPAVTMRLVKKDTDFTEYDEFIRDEAGIYEAITRKRRFGYYAQISTAGDKPVYFKEFGDPRIIDYQTGKETTAPDRAATEVIAFPIYSSYDAYGLPRWLGTMMDILGSRKAGYINYLFFDNKMIPPLIVTVSGGSLTKEAMTRLNEVINKEIRGAENFHNILVLEAVPASTSAIEGEKVAPVKIEVKPLTEFIQKDALFREYRADIKKMVRSQFGLAGIFTGDSDDYTRATANESTRVTEEQVFIPERRSFDYIIGRTIMADMQINYWTFRSLGAKTSNDTEIVNALAGVAEALPVAVIQQAVASMRNVPAGDILPELEQITLAEFKSRFTPQIPSFLTGGGAFDAGSASQGETIVKSLLAVRERLAKTLNDNGINTN